MERIVYLLGAGFSAPLGLPVMSNFYTKSRDMFLDEPSKYAHFKEVFDTIKELSIIKNFYDADLFNIEDILSILEMGEFLEGKNLKDEFLTYIQDVIRFYTPEFKAFEDGKLLGAGEYSLFGWNREWKAYAMFVGNLLNLSFSITSRRFKGKYQDISCQQQSNPSVRYSIITLNYDLIPDMIADFANRYSAPSGSPIAFNNGLTTLARLHGGVDTGFIIPPTWSKGVNKVITSAWKAAYQVLSEATQLRIIGYSLATADTYVKYLLKSAVMRDPPLKNIDVICRDRNGVVEVRYSDFIKLSFFRFANSEVMDYLEANVKTYPLQTDSSPPLFTLDKLEQVHAAFMSTRC